MYQNNDSHHDRHVFAQPPAEPRQLTYGEIAHILTEREGRDISAEHVRRLCGTAQKKIASALLQDQVFLDNR